MDPAFAVHNDEVPSVTLGENIAAIFKRGLEGVRCIAGVKRFGYVTLHFLTGDTGTFLLTKLRPRGSSIWTRDALSFCVNALDTVMAAATFKVTRYFFVLSIVVTEVNRFHFVGIYP